MNYELFERLKPKLLLQKENILQGAGNNNIINDKKQNSQYQIMSCLEHIFYPPMVIVSLKTKVKKLSNIFNTFI